MTIKMDKLINKFINNWSMMFMYCLNITFALKFYNIFFNICSTLFISLQ